MKLATCQLKIDDRASRSEPVEALDASWVRFGDEILLYAEDAKWDEVVEQAQRERLRLEEHPDVVKKDDMYLVIQNGRRFQQEHPNVPVLFDKGRFLVVEVGPEQAEQMDGGVCFSIKPLRDNTIVFDVRARAAERATPTAWVQNLVDNASRSDFEAYISHLASFPTRFSTSLHYGDAASWARGQLDEMGYATTVQRIAIPVVGSTSQNIIAERSGTESGTRDLVLVVAHLDSININGGPESNSPGADDNATGSAGLLEMARILKNHPARCDLQFVLFGGEEEGLLGSQQYIANLPATDQARIRCVINMDMIGTLNTSVPSVLLEGADVSRSLIDDLASAAATYTTLDVQTSLDPHNSDHVSFIENELPAVLTIEGTDGANSNVHTENDTLDHVDNDFALEIIRMNVATTAQALDSNGGTMTVPENATIPAELLAELRRALKELRGAQRESEAPRQLSGRYQYNRGVSTRQASGGTEASARSRYAMIDNPIYPLEEPIYLPDPVTPGGSTKEPAGRQGGIRFTLNIDIDGTDPLNIVSGLVAQDFSNAAGGSEPSHFIGQVTSDTLSGGTRDLVVEDFRFRWPEAGGGEVDRLEVKLAVSSSATPTAQATFIATGSNHRLGPYTAQQASPYFQDVEVEVDLEDGAVDVEPYNTLTHPDRPADLPEEDLTFEKAFAKAGVRITKSSSSNIINTADAGANNRWSEPELHDSMTVHWSAFANRPQWKMWVFLAELADRDTLGGVMFDADIDEPGGVDRQGTAIFTKSPFFHSVNGDYIKANPPEAEAVKRELFFNLIHETGHAFNLAHSFQKNLGTPWAAPSWMPVASDARALSWMNYPDQASSPPGVFSARWFYDRFRFRFDDDENLFLRHAPANLLQMGNETWFQNHGRVSRGDLDRRLELVVRSRKKIVELGEPVFCELRLRNVSDQAVMVHHNLDPSDGLVELAITNPRGERRPALPISHTRNLVQQHALEPGQAVYQAVNLTVGLFGFPFKEPGAYRVEASYTNTDGTKAAAVMQLYIRPPANYTDLPVVSEIFDARVGRVLHVGGTRVMEDVKEKLDWVRQRLGAEHPAYYYLTVTRGLPYSGPFKLLEADTNRVRLLESDPERAKQTLEPIVEHTAPAADALGHINYHQAVDVYTEAASEIGKRAEAREAQSNMLALFEARDVIPEVIKSVEERVEQLK
jgi:hypothetical protein